MRETFKEMLTKQNIIHGAVAMVSILLFEMSLEMSSSILTFGIPLFWVLFFCVRSQTVFESNRDATRILQSERGEAYVSGYFKGAEIYALLGLRLTDKKSDKTFMFILGGVIAGYVGYEIVYFIMDNSPFMRILKWTLLVALVVLPITMLFGGGNSSTTSSDDSDTDCPTCGSPMAWGGGG